MDKFTKLILLVIAVCLVISGIKIYLLEEKTKEEISKINKQQNTLIQQVNDLASYKISKEVLDAWENTVDLTTPNIQNIGRGFMVSKLDIRQHLTGIKLKGRIINSTALTHTNIKFKISIAEQEKEFNINKISMGCGTGFNVYIPDVPIEETRYAHIRRTGSMVSSY